ncbi:hypothetical protein XH99_02795 [Bradyrhizobium nanningense]|uniref:Uncharacterized protein n=1 Tax=Bradyrhizobium nanningense TaxID=1325118 RepID=A0A4V1L386_9BRAD|nr:hypothetical protein [Bradyrhizobium nanningense]RXH25787.1 hypothetical protein XH84_30940 [Bradyrhizobium nanningense]RXH37103.1 hypothetical protein XH99_02795 [Bradyrhizobium nanningense]
MSGHLRCYFASLVLLGGLAATPALSSPFTDLFNPAPREPAANSSARPECLAQPGNPPGAGLRWVYRREGHSKCWFLAEGVATAREPAHRRIANRTVRPDEDETMRQRRSPVSDARAELSSSAAAGEPQPTPAREVKVADAASVFDAGAPILIPAASVSGAPNSQLTPEQSVPPQVDAEKLSAAARADSSPAMPMGARDEQVLGEARSRTVTWLGVALMMLGSFSILSASRALRHAVRLRH